jgi:hypothetical protein
VQRCGRSGIEVGHPATLAPAWVPPAVRQRGSARQIPVGGPHSTPSGRRAARWVPSPRDSKWPPVGFGPHKHPNPCPSRTGDRPRCGRSRPHGRDSREGAT